MKLTRFLNPIPVVLILVAMSGCAIDRSNQAEAQIPARVTAQQFVERVAVDDVVLDVRTPSEFAGGHLEGAVNVDFRAADFVEHVEELDKEKTYYLYCRTGNRSGKAVNLMRQMGFTSVFDAGGFNKLAGAGAATTR